MILSHHRLDFQRYLAPERSNSCFVYYKVPNLVKYQISSTCLSTASLKALKIYTRFFFKAIKMSKSHLLSYFLFHQKRRRKQVLSFSSLGWLLSQEMKFKIKDI